MVLLSLPQTIKDDGPLKLFTQTIKGMLVALSGSGYRLLYLHFAMYPVDTIVRHDTVPQFSKNAMVELKLPAPMLVVLTWK
jgi:hypothetical protein